MIAISVRELKRRLSRYVRLVEAGEAVLVMKQGAVVAELRPSPHVQVRHPFGGTSEAS